MSQNTKYKNEFNKEKYDRVPIMIPKGDKEKLKNIAKEKGYKSLNEYMKALIYQDINGGVLKREFKGFYVIYPQPRFSKCVSQSSALRTKKIYPSPYMTQVRGKGSAHGLRFRHGP